MLLSSDTELIIAPKTRQPDASTANANKTHDLSTIDPENRTAPNGVFSTPAWEAVQKRLLRLLPLEALTRAEHRLTQENDDDNSLLVSSEDFNAIHRASPALRLNVHHQPRPNVKSAAGPESGAGTSSGPKDGKEDENLVPSETEVRIKESHAVPVGHAWTGRKIRQDLGLAHEGTSDGRFDMLRQVHRLNCQP